MPDTPAVTSPKAAPNSTATAWNKGVSIKHGKFLDWPGAEGKRVKSAYDIGKALGGVSEFAKANPVIAGGLGGAALGGLGSYLTGGNTLYGAGVGGLLGAGAGSAYKAFAPKQPAPQATPQAGDQAAIPPDQQLTPAQRIAFEELMAVDREGSTSGTIANSAGAATGLASLGAIPTDIAGLVSSNPTLANYNKVLGKTIGYLNATAGIANTVDAAGNAYSRQSAANKALERMRAAGIPPAEISKVYNQMVEGTTDPAQLAASQPGALGTAMTVANPIAGAYTVINPATRAISNVTDAVHAVGIPVYSGMAAAYNDPRNTDTASRLSDGAMRSMNNMKADADRNLGNQTASLRTSGRLLGTLHNAGEAAVRPWSAIAAGTQGAIDYAKNVWELPWYERPFALPADALRAWGVIR